MITVKDFQWKPGMTVKELVDQYQSVGFQSVELARASEVIVKMKKAGAKKYFTFTSNMVTSGLRGFFAQLVRLKMADVIVTTTGAIEEDIMRAHNEQFEIGSFDADDVELYETGVNRVGNLFIKTRSYENFEGDMKQILSKLYSIKPRWTVSDMLREIGLMLADGNSILCQAAKHNVPIFCPGITDGSFGFHLFMFQQTHPDFVVDVVKDFANILFSTSQDDIKGVIALGGGISKHHAIFACLLNVGMDYAVYITTAHRSSGSMGGATASEAKSWGKIKEDSETATVIGDVTVMFPIAMINALETLTKEGIVKYG